MLRFGRRSTDVRLGSEDRHSSCRIGVGFDAMTDGEGWSDRLAERPSLPVLRSEMARLLQKLDEIGLFQAAAYLSMSLDVLDRVAAHPVPSAQSAAELD